MILLKWLKRAADTKNNEKVALIDKQENAATTKMEKNAAQKDGTGKQEQKDAAGAFLASLTYADMEMICSVDATIKYTEDHNHPEFFTTTGQQVKALSEEKIGETALEKQRRENERKKKIDLLALRKEQKILGGVQALQEQLHAKLGDVFSIAGVNNPRDLKRVNSYTQKADSIVESREKYLKRKTVWLHRVSSKTDLMQSVKAEPAAAMQPALPAQPAQTEKQAEIVEVPQQPVGQQNSPYLERAKTKALEELKKIQEQRKAKEEKAAKEKADKENREKEAAKNKKPSLRARISNFLKRNLNTSTLYLLEGLYTGIRLVVIRIARIAKTFNRSFLKKWFAILGFSYAIELIADLAIMAKEAFRRSTDKEKEEQPNRLKRFFNRVKNVFLKDGRPVRMLNAFVWIILNVLTFALTGGLSTVAQVSAQAIVAANGLTLAGFIFDVGLEAYVAIREYVKHTRLINKLRTCKSGLVKEITDPKDGLLQKMSNLKIQIKALEKEITALKENTLDEKAEILQEKKNELIQKKIELANIPYEINKKQTAIQECDFLIDKLKEKRAQVNFEKVYRVFFTFVVLVSMGLLIFPPTSLVGAAALGVSLTGAILSFAGGSVFMGLGKRIFDKIKAFLTDFFSKKPPAPEFKEEKLNEEELQKELATTAQLNVGMQSANSNEKIEDNISVNGAQNSHVHPNKGLTDPSKKSDPRGNDNDVGPVKKLVPEKTKTTEQKSTKPGPTVVPWPRQKSVTMGSMEIKEFNLDNSEPEDTVVTSTANSSTDFGLFGSSPKSSSVFTPYIPENKTFGNP